MRHKKAWTKFFASRRTWLWVQGLDFSRVRRSLQVCIKYVCMLFVEHERKIFFFFFFGRTNLWFFDKFKKERHIIRAGCIHRIRRSTCRIPTSPSPLPLPPPAKKIFRVMVFFHTCAFVHQTKKKKERIQRIFAIYLFFPFFFFFVSLF